MANEIKPGDVVQLKSGGPLMTVNSVEAEYGGTTVKAWCTWFDGKKECNGAYPLHSLNKA
jgi:uncharacterized protein YodC (DUF2158 family)